MEMQIIKLYKNCPDCGSRTEKLTADVYICLNPDCNHIDVSQLFDLLKSVGVDADLPKKLERGHKKKA